MPVTTYEHILSRSGAFVRFLAGLNRHKIGANQTIYTWRSRRNNRAYEFNVGFDRGIHFGDSSTGTDGLWVHPGYVLDEMSPDGRTVVQEAVVRLDALFLTHDHADHYSGIVMDLLHKHNYNLPQLLGPRSVRLKYIVECKKAGLPDDLIKRYFGAPDELPAHQRFIELEPYQAITIEQHGTKLDVLPVCLPHSSYLSLSYLVKAPNGTVYLHLSDFKSDMSIYPNGQDPYGLTSVPELFKHPAVASFLKGARLQMVAMESTNAMREGPQTSEGDCLRYLQELAAKTPKRLVCFVMGGSQPRYRTMAEVARKSARLLEVVGVANQDAVRHLGRFDEPWLNIRQLAGKMVFSGSKMARRMYAAEPASVLTIGSGPNGEYIANLASALDGRIDNRLKLDPAKDTIVLSSSIIPGNEDRVLELIGKARRKGFDVVMPPLSVSAKPEHQQILAEINAIEGGSLTITDQVHSSGHDAGDAMLALALACPDNPSFAIIHGGNNQRQALAARLLDAGLRVINHLQNGCTVPVPDKRTGKSLPTAIMEFPADIFQTFTKVGGFGSEGAYHFGSHPVTEEGVPLKRLGGGGLGGDVVTVTLQGRLTGGVNLQFIAEQPLTYEARVEQKPQGLRRAAPQRPAVRKTPANSNLAPKRKRA